MSGVSDNHAALKAIPNPRTSPARDQGYRETDQGKIKTDRVMPTNLQSRHRLNVATVKKPTINRIESILPSRGGNA